MKINWSRVILGGLLAGLIINVCEYLVNGLLLEGMWAEAMKSLNRPSAMDVTAQIAFNVSGFALGILALWFYAHLRGIYGPGPRTAMITGVVVWIPGSLLGMVGPAALHLFRYRLIAIAVVLGLVEILLGTVAGAWLYKDSSAPAATKSAAAAA